MTNAKTNPETNGATNMKIKIQVCPYSRCDYRAVDAKTGEALTPWLPSREQAIEAAKKA
jgi:hypothetical protein